MDANDLMEKFTVKYQVIVLIILGILGSIALGTFAPSTEGVLQIIFAIGMGLVLWFGGKESIQAQSWSNFGLYSLYLSGVGLLLNCLPLAMGIVFPYWVYAASIVFVLDFLPASRESCECIPPL